MDIDAPKLSSAPAAGAEESALALLLDFATGPSAKAAPVPVRTGRGRLDSLDQLADVATRSEGSQGAESTEEDDEDIPEDGGDAERLDATEEDTDSDATTAAALSAGAATFFERRRAAAEKAAERAAVGEHGDASADYNANNNTEGRIGAYTVEERQYIIERFMAKRMHRRWNKKIRYGCRKSLADRRVRIRGRFVKAETAAEITVTAAVSAGAGSMGVGAVPLTAAQAGANAATLANAYVPAAALRGDAIRVALETLGAGRGGASGGGDIALSAPGLGGSYSGVGGGAGPSKAISRKQAARDRGMSVDSVGAWSVLSAPAGGAAGVAPSDASTASGGSRKKARRSPSVEDEEADGFVSFYSVPGAGGISRSGRKRSLSTSLL